MLLSADSLFPPFFYFEFQEGEKSPPFFSSCFSFELPFCFPYLWPELFSSLALVVLICENFSRREAYCLAYCLALLLALTIAETCLASLAEQIQAFIFFLFGGECCPFPSEKSPGSALISGFDTKRFVCKASLVWFPLTLSDLLLLSPGSPSNPSVTSSLSSH